MHKFHSTQWVTILSHQPQLCLFSLCIKGLVQVDDIDSQSRIYWSDEPSIIYNSRLRLNSRIMFHGTYMGHHIGQIKTRLDVIPCLIYCNLIAPNYISKGGPAYRFNWKSISRGRLLWWPSIQGDWKSQPSFKKKHKAILKFISVVANDEDLKRFS